MAFEYVLAARLKSMSPEVAKTVLKAYRNYFVGYVDEINGEQRDGKNVNIFVPKKMAKSWVEYFVLLHELEHTLQMDYLEKFAADVAKGKVKAQIPAYIRKALKQHKENGATKKELIESEIYELLANLDNSPYYRYHLEGGAMMSEWHYLNLVPQELRRKVAQQIETDPAFAKKTKKTMLRALAAGSNLSSPISYVQNERRNGRYTKKSILKDLALGETRGRFFNSYLQSADEHLLESYCLFNGSQVCLALLKTGPIEQ